jgi:hypothetical protein
MYISFRELDFDMLGGEKSREKVCSKGKVDSPGT